MNIGFIVNNLGNSEQTHEVMELINKISIKDNKFVPYIFFENVVSQIAAPSCLSMNITGISNFKGKTLSFGLGAAQILSSNNANTENWVMLWDIPWLSNVVNYPVCLELLSKFKIIVRSEDHKEIVANFTGRSDVIVAKNADEILKCLT